MKKFILLCLIPLFSSHVFAECKANNVYDDIACYEKELKTNKTILNQTYQKLYQSMDDSGKTILEKSQKNWLAYKNSHCDELIGHLSLYTLGAGSHLINLSCNSDLIEQRIKQLKELNDLN